MKSMFAMAALAATVCVAACSDSSGPEREQATTIAVISGNNQQGHVSFPVPQPLVIEVRDQHHLPMKSATVTFTTTSNGSIDMPTVYTDSTGQASVTFTLSTTSGTDSVFARVDGVDQPAIFVFTANPGPAMHLEEIGPAQESGTPGAVLATPFVVELVDLFGNPIAGAPVTWTTTGGTLSATSEVTDENGKASVTLTLPAGAGTQTVTAHAENVADAVFLAVPVQNGG